MIFPLGDPTFCSSSIVYCTGCKCIRNATKSHSETLRFTLLISASMCSLVVEKPIIPYFLLETKYIVYICHHMSTCVKRLNSSQIHQMHNFFLILGLTPNQQIIKSQQPQPLTPGRIFHGGGCVDSTCGAWPRWSFFSTGTSVAAPKTGGAGGACWQTPPCRAKRTIRI